MHLCTHACTFAYAVCALSFPGAGLRTGRYHRASSSTVFDACMAKTKPGGLPTGVCERATFRGTEVCRYVCMYAHTHAHMFFAGTDARHATLLALRAAIACQPAPGGDDSCEIEPDLMMLVLCVCVCVCVCVVSWWDVQCACARTHKRPHAAHTHAHTHARAHVRTRARANTHKPTTHTRKIE